MPLPATHLQSVQATVKMANASDLSLRGGRRPTWQSRSTRPHRGKATGETATAFPRLPRRFAPRNDTSGEREVHQCPPAVELLPTGRSLSAATGPVGGGCHLTIACANRLCSTGRGQPGPATHLQSVQATVKMAPASDLSLRGGRRPTWRPERAARGSALGVQSREGSHDFADSLSVIRLGTARLPRRFAPRNDKLGGHCFLTLARTSRRCSTGRGMPLPYNGGYHETAAGTGRQCLPEIATSLRSSQ